MGVDDQVLNPELILDVKREGTTARIAVRGEFDAYSAPALEQQISELLDDHVREMVLDLSETTFLDSSGLRAILTAHRRLASEGGKLTLRSPSTPVARLLDITGLADHFTVEP